MMAEANTRDLFGLTVLNNNHKDIRALKKAHGQTSLHGNKLWQASSLMVDYLRTAPPPEGSRVLDVGCGWGIAGIYCAKHYGAHVTAMDADATVFPYLEHHASINGVTLHTQQRRVEQITATMLREYSMVIASDICFWDEMSKPLFNLVNRCYKAGVQRIVMTDPGRPPFRNMVELCLQKYDALYDNWSVPHPYNTSGVVLDIG